MKWMKVSFSREIPENFPGGLIHCLIPIGSFAMLKILALSGYSVNHRSRWSKACSVFRFPVKKKSSPLREGS